jgi:hypothetical protein
MNTELDMTFQQAYEGFTKQTLAIYKAKYLLLPENSGDLSEIELEEVQRELNLSEYMAEFYFNILLEKGIPQHLLSLHLQVFI